MTPIRDPRSDDRNAKGGWSEGCSADALTPRNEVLTRQFQRIQDLTRNPVSNTLLKNERVKAKSSVSTRHVDAAPRSSGRPGDGDVTETISSLHELRIVELRRLQRSAGRNLMSGPRTIPGDREHREDAPAPAPPNGRELVTGAVRASWDGLRSLCRFLLHRQRSPNATDADGDDLAGRLRHDFSDQLRTGLRVLILGIGVAGGWAVVVPLSAAVMVAGTLVVESNVKKIQHPTGGVVAKILARDGMHVNEGELVVRLDEVQVRTNLQVLAKQLDQVRVRIARLLAERDATEEPKLPRELAARTGDKELEQLFMSETALFKARAVARQSQKELLRGQISQHEEEIAGLNAQIKSKAAQLELISKELQGVQGLYEKQLVPLMRLTALQRDAARLDGERGQLTSTIAETRSKISSAELQIGQIDQDLRTEVMKDLRDSQDKEAELAERIVAAQDQLDRIDIRAPTSGVVHQLSVHTIGGVIKPGDVIMEIVPDADDLQIQAKLSPNDIDQVRMDQGALVRFSAFNQRTTPQLNGAVSYVSADLSRENQTDAPYYTVRVRIPGNERRRLGSLQLVSGMPAEVFLQTGSRTMMSYLLKPVTDQLQRTFSER